VAIPQTATPSKSNDHSEGFNPKSLPSLATNAIKAEVRSIFASNAEQYDNKSVNQN